jgi:transcriptional regulator with XRE-family HTH domain
MPIGSSMIDAIVLELVVERKREGLSMREIARRSGISSGGLCELERGDHSPTLKHLRAWAAALDYDIQLVSTPREENA